VVVTRVEVAFAGTKLAVEYAGLVAERLVTLLLSRVERAPAELATKVTLTLTDDALLEDGVHVVRGADLGLLAEHLQERIAYHFADGCHEGLVVHAGAVAKDGRALLLPAQSGSGKSTLTTWLSTRGYQHMGDELVHVSARDSVLQGWMRPLGIKHGSLEVIAPHLSRPSSSDTWLDTPMGAIVSPALFSPVPSAQSALAAAIVFPRFERGRPEVSMRALSPADVSARLLQCVLNARHLPAHGLTDVAALCRRVPGHELVYGSFETLEGRLAGLVT
jgi:hypothetical protein